jgi:hypothetical protein
MAILVSDVLPLETCPRCRVDLPGPPPCRCRACGFACDRSMFLLEGWRLPDQRTWHRRLVVWGPFALLAAVVAVVDYGWNQYAVVAIVAAAAAVIGVLYLVGGRAGGQEGKALATWLLSADGVSRPGRATWLWKNYSHVILLRDGGGAYRLHMYPSWWWPIGPPMVNARLECDESDAAAVRNEIQHRINAARREE